ncbi:hypothetical protein GQ457_01G013530 [Hibiscus cannabinus]
MAGLQYNFFPTDFYFSSPQSLPDAARVAAVTIQAPKRDLGSTSAGDINDLEWPRGLGFRVHRPKNTDPARLHTSFRQQQLHVEDQTKPVKHYPNPLCWLDLSPEHLPGSS